MTNEINKYRSDLRLSYLLCKVGRERADYILRTGDRRHSFTLLRRALAENGVCWTNSGEVLTTTNYDPSAAHFVRNWRGSSSHWNILMASRYDRGGGTWRAAGGRYQAVYYVLDTC